MKTKIRRENNEFFLISLKHVSGRTGHANPPVTPKMWAIAHEKGHKHENNDFFVMPSYIFGYYGRYKLPGTQKLWAITHENVQKTQKGRGFGRNSQKM